jgi:hypothetical protein
MQTQGFDFPSQNFILWKKPKKKFVKIATLFFEIFYFQFRFLAILHQQKEKAPTYLPTYQLRGSIGP